MSTYGSAESGPPDFEGGSEYNDLIEAFKTYEQRCDHTFGILSQWLENPVEELATMPTLKRAIEREAKGFEIVMGNYWETEAEEFQKLESIACVMHNAKQKRMEFLKPLVPELTLSPYPERDEVVSMIREMVVQEEFDFEENSWEVVDIYRDELQHDITTLQEFALEIDNSEPEKPVYGSSFFRDVSKLAAGIALGKLTAQAISRRLGWEK